MVTVTSSPDQPPSMVIVSPEDDRSQRYSVYSHGTATTTSGLVISHILDNVLELPEDDEIRIFVKNNRVRNIGQLIKLPASTLNAFGLGYFSVLTIQHLAQWAKAEGSSLDHNAWLRLDATGFNDFVLHRATSDLKLEELSTSTQSNPVTNTSSTSTVVAPTPTRLLPGTKRNILDYTQLKEDSKWFSWKRDFKATADSHGLWHIFNPEEEYKPDPLNTAKVQQYEMEQRWSFRVLIHCFQTVRAKRFTRGTYAKCNDTRRAYLDLVEAYENDMDIQLQKAEN